MNNMNTIFDYINTNSVLATMIGIILGWILNFFSTMYFHKREEKLKEKKQQVQKRRNSLKLNQNCILKKIVKLRKKQTLKSFWELFKLSTIKIKSIKLHIQKIEAIIALKI